MRIQARAIQRLGQLLEQIEKGIGQHKQNGRASPALDRKSAAGNAGLSEHEKKTALSAGVSCRRGR